jgi:hypothetical protein
MVKVRITRRRGIFIERDDAVPTAAAAGMGSKLEGAAKANAKTKAALAELCPVSSRSSTASSLNGSLSNSHGRSDCRNIMLTMMNYS